MIDVTAAVALPAARRDGPVRAIARAIVSSVVTVLAVAFLVGMALDPLRPGSALHPHALGAGPLATALALAFALVRCGRWGCAAGAREAARRVEVVLAALGAAAAGCAAIALQSDDHAEYVFRSGAPSASALVAWTLGLWAFLGARDPAAAPTLASRLRRTVGFGAAATGLVLAWILAVGAVDYVPREGGGCDAEPPRADAIVVFGSRVHADGTPSGSLVDRTVTACDLWKRGVARVIVLSGGRGADAPISEPEAMRAIARAQGVPDGALILDEAGATTAATVRNAAALAKARDWTRIAAVSHDYHGARIRLLCARAGLAVRTSPAVETRPAGWKVPLVAREVVAWIAAYVT